MKAAEATDGQSSASVCAIAAGPRDFFPQLSLPGVARVRLDIESGEADVDALLQVLGKSGGNPASKRMIPSHRGRPKSKSKWTISPEPQPRESMVNSNSRL